MQQEMMNYLMGMDVGLFHLTNAVWTNPLLDTLMPPESDRKPWGSVARPAQRDRRLRREAGRRIALAGLVALAIGFVSSAVIKEITMRPRPFAVLPDVRVLVGAPHSYALPSGHTTSAFGAASGVLLAAKRFLGRVPVWGWGMLALAAAIAYSRLYVGVHWPTDVAAGIVLGMASGRAGVHLALRRWRRSDLGRPERTATPVAATDGVGEVEYGEVIQR